MNESNEEFLLNLIDEEKSSYDENEDEEEKKVNNFPENETN